MIDRSGADQGDGLRHRPGGRRHRRDDDPDPGRHRHGPVPLARAGPGPARRRPLRPLLHRLPALRAAHRPAAVPGRLTGRDRLPARRRAAAATVDAQPGRRPALDAIVAARAGQGPRGPLPERHRVPRRPRRPRGSGARSATPRAAPPAVRPAPTVAIAAPVAGRRDHRARPPTAVHADREPVGSQHRQPARRSATTRTTSRASGAGWPTSCSSSRVLGALGAAGRRGQGAARTDRRRRRQGRGADRDRPAAGDGRARSSRAAGLVPEATQVDQRQGGRGGRRPGPRRAPSGRQGSDGRHQRLDRPRHVRAARRHGLHPGRGDRPRSRTSASRSAPSRRSTTPGRQGQGVHHHAGRRRGRRRGLGRQPQRVDRQGDRARRRRQDPQRGRRHPRRARAQREDDLRRQHASPRTPCSKQSIKAKTMVEDGIDDHARPSPSRHRRRRPRPPPPTTATTDADHPADPDHDRAPPPAHRACAADGAGRPVSVSRPRPPGRRPRRRGPAG